MTTEIESLNINYQCVVSICIVPDMKPSDATSFPEILQYYADKSGISLREVGRQIGDEKAPGHWRIRHRCAKEGQALAAAAVLGPRGHDLDRFLMLASLEHIPDESARARILAAYDGHRDLKLKLKLMQRGLEEAGDA